MILTPCELSECPHIFEFQNPEAIDLDPRRAEALGISAEELLGVEKKEAYEGNNDIMDDHLSTHRPSEWYQEIVAYRLALQTCQKSLRGIADTIETLLT
jgi:hypothetical protein